MPVTHYAEAFTADPQDVARKFGHATAMELQPRAWVKFTHPHKMQDGEYAKVGEHRMFPGARAAEFVRMGVAVLADEPEQAG